MTDTRPRVALVPWGDVFEDYLDEIGLSLRDFLDDVSGGWIFGYVKALAGAGVETVLVIVSRSVRAPERRVHRATGAPVWVIPPPRIYRAVRRQLVSGFAM